ncbi:MAG: SurA N-terminal domain-containing protein [Muribaculaceae bacterium]|nr:SurA N-terminal domain-containing protein [Muribaculaceae bacterium]
MATLEKIRNKSVLLIVVIGVALLAFIIGDFFTSGRTFFGNATTVAVVGDKKIDIQEFQRRYEEMSAQMQQRNQSVDAALVQQQVLNGMIQEILLDNEIDELGIEVSADELSESMVGKNANPQMMQFAQQMGAQSPAQLYDMIFNPSNYGITEEQVTQARAQWLKMEKSTEQQLKYMKLGSLIAGAIQANDLDKAAINEESAISHINIVKKEYSSLKDGDFAVSDEDIKAEYNKEKNKYKLDTEVRRIHYIAVDIKPSATDENEAQKLFNKAVGELEASTGVDAVRANSDLFINESTITLASANPQIKSFIETAEVNAMTPVKHVDDTYSITRLIAKKLDTDSVKVNMIAVEGAKNLQDSILNLLNNGTDLKVVEKMKGIQGVQDSLWINLMQAQDAKAKEKILNAPATYFVLDSNEKAALIYKVIEKKAPKLMYDIAEVSYKVIPSETTVQSLRDGLQSFIASNNTSETFAANAIKANYQAVETSISSDMAQIDRIENTRKGIQWIFGAEKNSVSPIFDKEANNKMIVYSVDEIMSEGFTPITDKDLRTQLTNKIRRDKKAAKLIADYTGKAKNIEGFAAVMNSSVDTTTCNFAQPFIAMVGYEPALAGSIAAAKPGVVSKVIKGNNAVYVYQVTSIDNNGPKLSPKEAGERYAMTLGGNAIMQNAIEILRKATKVDNQMIKFY